jgi:hypothetical protein
MNAGGTSASHPLANAFLKRRVGTPSSVHELDDIGQSEGVHRTTAGRWLSRIRTSLLKTVRLKLSNELGFRGSSLQSIIGEIESRIDASMTDFFDYSASRRSDAAV